jgi:hypothetical protein
MHDFLGLVTPSSQRAHRNRGREPRARQQSLLAPAPRFIKDNIRRAKWPDAPSCGECQGRGQLGIIANRKNRAGGLGLHPLGGQMGRDPTPRVAGAAQASGAHGRESRVIHSTGGGQPRHHRAHKLPQFAHLFGGRLVGLHSRPAIDPAVEHASQSRLGRRKFAEVRERRLMQ